MNAEHAPEPITVLLHRAANGEADANDRLLKEIYPVLRKLAHNQLSRHRRDTLCTTCLLYTSPSPRD